MENTKIGNKEAIALLVTITFNQIILNVTKTIVDYFICWINYTNFHMSNLLFFKQISNI